MRLPQERYAQPVFLVLGWCRVSRKVGNPVIPRMIVGSVVCSPVAGSSRGAPGRWPRTSQGVTGGRGASRSLSGTARGESFSAKLRIPRRDRLGSRGRGQEKEEENQNSQKDLYCIAQHGSQAVAPHGRRKKAGRSGRHRAGKIGRSASRTDSAGREAERGTSDCSAQRKRLRADGRSRRLGISASGWHHTSLRAEVRLTQTERRPAACAPWTSSR